MSIKEPGRHLRTNYRLTGGKIDYGALDSMLVQLRESYQMESDNDGIFTFSMKGYGIPLWVNVKPMIATMEEVWMAFSVSIDGANSGSIVYVSIGALSAGVSLGFGAASLPDTITIPFQITALIASR